MRTIRVTGKGQIKVRPDMTRITLSLEGFHKEYGETLRRSSEDTEKLKTLLGGYGFAAEDLKTLYFSVDTEYESYKEKDVYKSRFVGYRYHHNMKVEFASDNERLGRILYGLAASPVKPEFHFSFFVGDPEDAKNELLGRAVADSREKAEVLTKAAGVCLKEVQSIDYSWGEIDLEVRPMNRMLMAEESASFKARGESFDMNIEPDDIEVSDTVTVVWEIE